VESPLRNQLVNPQDSLLVVRHRNPRLPPPRFPLQHLLLCPRIDPVGFQLDPPLIDLLFSLLQFLQLPRVLQALRLNRILYVLLRQSMSIT
jgi:hypothetical protein